MRHVALLCALVVAIASGCASAAAGCDASCTRVLFIGNSYTSVNDLPSVVAGLARARGHQIAVTMIAPGGETFGGHAATPETIAAIATGGWSVVVLQEQSQIPASPAWRSTMLPPARSLAAQARAVRARVVLFLTWPHRDGWPEQGLPGHARMAAAIAATYGAVAADLGAEVAPVGVAWERAIAESGDIALWQDDGSHPTRAGTYLAACVFVATLFGEMPQGLPSIDGVPDSVAAVLQRAAAEAVMGIVGRT